MNLFCAIAKSMGQCTQEIKPTIKPIGTIDINTASSILLDKLEEMGDDKAEIYLPDSAIKIYKKDEVAKSFELKEVSSIKYVAETHDCIKDLEVAYGLGLFFADGSCGLRNGRYGGAFWRIVGWKKDCLERVAQAFEGTWPDMAFPLRLYSDYQAGSLTNYGARKKSLYCMEVAPRERHNDGTRGRFIEEFHRSSYSHKEKKVHKEMWGSSSISKRAFLEGVISGDGSVITENRGQITCHGKVALAGLVDMMLDCGWTFHIRPEKGKDNSCLSYNKATEKLAAIPACDDFAAELYGKFAGLAWTNLHALNWFYDENSTFWWIEPQTKKLSLTIGGWQGSNIRFYIAR